MDNEQVAEAFPKLLRWIDEYLAAFEQSRFDGITYWDTTHFHELVHVIRWEVLGSDFLLAYADGLLKHGYTQAPLKRMAYGLEEFFRNGLPMDVETQVRDETVSLARRLGLSGRPPIT